MRGKQPGRPVKRVVANVAQPVPIGRVGVRFEIWSKWKRRRKKHGTLVVSVGGLRWWPHKGTATRQCNWEKVAKLLDSV